MFLNHEGVMSDVGKDAGGLYSFNFPLAALDGLLFAGVDVVSLANNHSFDWGGVALCDTKRRLNSRGVGVLVPGVHIRRRMHHMFMCLMTVVASAFSGIPHFIRVVLPVRHTLVFLITH